MDPETVGDAVADAAETVGEVAAEIIKAPFTILGSFFDRLTD